MCNTRKTSIDAIKIIAMLMIIGMHTNLDKIVADDKYTSCIGTTCGIAIPLFFMVSGYLISKKDITFQYILHKERSCCLYRVHSKVSE